MKNAISKYMKIKIFVWSHIGRENVVLSQIWVGRLPHLAPLGTTTAWNLIGLTLPEFWNAILWALVLKLTYLLNLIKVN